MEQLTRWTNNGTIERGVRYAVSPKWYGSKKSRVEKGSKKSSQ
jgi:hypothetical protein